MTLARTLVAASALLLVACSSGSAAVDDEARATTEAQQPTESVDEAPTATAADDTDPAAGSDDEATNSIAAGPEATDPELDPDEQSGDETDGDGLVIDGPAQVRPSCASLPPGVSEFTLDVGGGVHDVRIYMPTSASSDPVPTVLSWHGLGQSGPQQATLTGYEALAEEEGFAVVHATGLPGALGVIENANSWEIAQFDTPDRDDLAFADALIDTIVADWCGDPSRIYSTGMSNGGLFTSELVCNRSTRIAAAASIAGTTHVDECQPERTVPYIAFHGTADTVVPFTLDVSSVLLQPDEVSALIGAGTPGEFAEFAVDAECDLEPIRVEETAEVVRYDYTGCTDGVPMVFYEIVGGGHTWPGSPLTGPLDDGGELGTTAQDIDATVDGWAFMSQHSL